MSGSSSWTYWNVAPCGNVSGSSSGDRVIDVGSEWRTFTNEKATQDPSRVGDAQNPLLNGGDLSTMISKVSTHKVTAYRERCSKLILCLWSVARCWCLTRRTTYKCGPGSQTKKCNDKKISAPLFVTWSLLGSSVLHKIDFIVIRFTGSKWIMLIKGSDIANVL